MPDELKTCPFCGAKGILEDWFGADAVVCESDSCGGMVISASPDEAVGMWNRRAEEADTDA